MSIFERQISIEPIRSFWHRYRAHELVDVDVTAMALVDWTIASRIAIPKSLVNDLVIRTKVPTTLLSIAIWYAKRPEANEYVMSRAWLALAAAENRGARMLHIEALRSFAKSTASVRRQNLELRQQRLAEMDIVHGFSIAAVANDIVEATTFALLASADAGETAGTGEVAQRDKVDVIKAAANTIAEAEVGGPTCIVVMPEAPAPAGEREIRELLKLFDVLRRPIRVSWVDGDWRSALDAQFPWMRDIIDRIAGDVRMANGDCRIKPTLLVGPPGCGKSAFAAALAIALDAPFCPISFASQSEARALLGTARGWSSTTPSMVIEAMRRHGCASPMVFIDEVEKSVAYHVINPRAALLTMTEPSTSAAWQDPCLQVAVDLSRVIWIAAANDLDTIEAPMRSRFRVLQVPAPRAEHWPAIKSALLGMIAHDTNMPTEAMPEIDPEVDARLETLLDRCGDLRVARRAVENVVRLGLEHRDRRLN